METVEAFLRYPLVELAGGTVTPAALLTGLVIIIVTLVIGRLAAATTLRVLTSRGAPTGSGFAFAKIVRYGILLVGVSVAINSLGLKMDAVLAASAVLLVGIGFGLQNVAQNFISGLILLVEQPVRKDDYIKVGAAFGQVRDIGLRATTVVTRDEVTIVVPNSELMNSQVINHSQPTSNVRLRVKVGVAYGTDTALVQTTLLAVAAANPSVLKVPAPTVRFEEFGDSSLDFLLLAWVADPGDDLPISSSLRFGIDAAFRDAGIAIPFPQRDLHLKSGVPAPPGG